MKTRHAALRNNINALALELAAATGRAEIRCLKLRIRALEIELTELAVAEG